VKTVFSLFTVLLLLQVSGLTQVGEDQPSLKKKKKLSVLSLMEYEKVIPVTLCADVTDLIEDRFDQTPRHGWFSFSDSTGTEVRLPVKLETRGKTRLVRCALPPIEVRFDKPALAEGKIKDYPKLKTVIPCTENMIGMDLLFRELLIYELYEIVSDYAFRTQAAELTCMDTGGVDTTHVISSFFIESDKEFRKRHKVEELEEYNVQWKDTDPHQSQILAVFQYMIGNTDWKIALKHNLRYFRKKEGDPLILVPYDFDFSGIVNAGYAKPNPDYLQENVRQRIYIGQPNQFLKPTLELFKNKKAEIFETIDNAEHLSIASRTDIRAYIESFYATIDNKRKCRRAFRKFDPVHQKSSR